MSEASFSLDSLRQVALGCKDVDRSVAFYRDLLGAELIAHIPIPGLAFFRMGNVRLLLEASEESQPGSSTLYFGSGDIHRDHAILVERGIVFESPPHLIHSDEAGVFGPEGEEEWMAFFRDPDGNSLALAARIAK